MSLFGAEVLPLVVPRPAIEATCNFTPIELERAHLKGATGHFLTAEERGIAEGDAMAVAQGSCEVFLDQVVAAKVQELSPETEVPFEEAPESPESDLGEQSPTE